MTRRTLAVWLVIVGSIVSFSVVTLAASSGKTIPFDEVNHRLETVLQELSRTAQARPLALSQLAQDRGITLARGDSITVIIEPVSGNASQIDRAAVRALGGTIEATSKSLMRVRVPINRLEAMADQVNGIAFIRLPYQPRPLVVTSEGVALTGASDFHTAGFYGQGTKVAIIDLGFIGLTAAQAAGELVNVVYTHDYTGGGLETYTNHGTGVAEIVADMAPQASLYLLMIGDSVDLQNATAYCITNGIDIINHSVGWYNTNYYDGTGTVAGIANNARDNGILWVNAAGNEASDGHWQGAFVDSDSDGYLDFGSGSDYVDGDLIDEGNRIYATIGEARWTYAVSKLAGEHLAKARAEAEEIRYVSPELCRRSNKEFIQYLFIAKGSAAEVQSQLYTALDQDYISQEQFDEIYTQIETIAKQISRFITYLKTAG